VALGLFLGPAKPAQAVSFGGSIAVTSDYIYRGYSETSNEGAAQLDLHVSTLTGTFAGIWVSTLDRYRRPWADADLEAYIGQRFVLSSAWSTSITATNYSYVGGNQPYSSDYQQLTASVSWLDRWTLSFSAIPNMLRYWRNNTVPYPEYERSGRYPAYDVETSGQWLLGKGFFLTGGAGYYLFTGTDSTGFPQPSTGYVYGNVGLAYEWRNWRIDVGYFLTENAAVQTLFPYPTAGNRFAGTLSWRF
jgi:uncharacterized protein (TIGR02001 family)